MIQEGHFNADVVVVDGFDFEKANAEEIRNFRQFAAETGIEAWFSASTRETGCGVDANGIPNMLQKFLPDISVFIELEMCGKYIHLKLVKDHETIPATDLHLKLDPQILLIAEDTGPLAG